MLRAAVLAIAPPWAVNQQRLEDFVRVGGMELALEHRMQQHRDAVQHARHRTMLETLQARRGGNDWRDF